MNDAQKDYNRQMLRSAFQSLFWGVLLARKRSSKFTLTALADKLGIGKSYVSRSFSSPPNWQIDKISDMADALGVELRIEAHDPLTGEIYTPTGIVRPAHTTSIADIVEQRSVTQGAKTFSQTPSPKPQLVPVCSDVA